MMMFNVIVCTISGRTILSKPLSRADAKDLLGVIECSITNDAIFYLSGTVVNPRNVEYAYITRQREGYIPDIDDEEAFR